MEKKKRGRVWPKKEIIIHKNVIECDKPKLFVREFIELLEDVKEKSVIEEYLESKNIKTVSKKPKSKPESENVHESKNIKTVSKKPKSKPGPKPKKPKTKPKSKDVPESKRGRHWPEKKVVAYVELRTTRPKTFERKLKTMIKKYDSQQKEMLVDII